MAESDDSKQRPLSIDDDSVRYPLETMMGGKQSRRRSTSTNIHEQAGRIPPQAVEVEQSVLGAMLLAREAIPQAIEILQPDSFYDIKHQRIYEAMLSLFERSNPVDLITLTEELKRREQLDDIGGAYYLAQLSAGVASAANIEYHARILAEKSLLRQLIETMTRVVGKAYDPSTDAFDLLDEAERDIFMVSESQLRQSSRDLNDVLKETLKRLEAIHGKEGGITGVPSGFHRLDDMTGGWQNSDLIIIAARPSMGKCLSFDSEITLTDGSIRTIEDIYHYQQGELLTLGPNQTFDPVKPSDYIDDGIKPVFRISTRLGRTVETTLTHPFLTLKGWKPLRELKPGQKLAVPRRLPVFGSNTLPPAYVKLLAYFTGTGASTETELRCIHPAPHVQYDFSESVKTFDRLNRGSLEQWLHQHGLGNTQPHERSVPEVVSTLDRSLLALYLNRLFATDGRVSGSGDISLDYNTTSKSVAGRVQHLLLRFGILSRLSHHLHADHTSWHLEVTDHRSIRTFIAEIGILGREPLLERTEANLNTRLDQTHLDLQIPLNRVSGPGTALHAPVQSRLAVLVRTLAAMHMANSDVYWDEIESIEYAGRKQVYDLTIPDTHNFVANDICVHNTAFSLSLARNAALHPDTEKVTPIAIFSLEMSAGQLAQRLLTAEARIDAQDARTGRIKDEDWPSLARAAGRLSAAKIFIDDTPSLGVLELRAKCRRLKAEHNIGLVIVDYLQLMHGPKGKVQNREQEIAAISRSLKALAKELNVPVLALAQLSRAVETRGGDKRPMLSDLRESGCLTGDTLVPLAGSGKRVPIRTLAGKSGFHVWAVNPETLKLEAAPVSHAFSTGIKQVYKLRTRLGRTIRATANHKFLTIHGWKRLDELSEQDHLALPRELPTQKKQTISNDSDLYWDRIDSISEDGTEEVFDLTVPESHNFVANNIVVHNSIEQDADVVLFIYRAERYGITVDENGNSTEGIGEIIIGKQRNGPIGAVQLAFVNKYARFENLTSYYAAPDQDYMGDSDGDAAGGDGYNPTPPPLPPNRDAPF